MRNSLAIILLVLCSTVAAAQSGSGLNHPLNNDLNRIYERDMNRQESVVHTGMRPYIEGFSVPAPSIRYGWEDYEDQQPTVETDKAFWRYVWRKLRHESLIEVDSAHGGEFRLWIDPVFVLTGGIDPEDNRAKLDTQNIYNNSRGVQVRGKIGNKVAFGTDFYETQTLLPAYQEAWAFSRGEYRFSQGTGRWAQENAVVMGQGRTKDFKNIGFDFNLASGYVSYTPFKWWNVQAGTGKHFVGEGYRSLLLSDNAFNYPYVRSTTSWFNNKLQYTNIWASLSTLNRIPETSTTEPLYIPKTGSFHYLSFAPSKSIQLGLFEGIIWDRWDSTGTKDFDARFVNPVIGTNTLMMGTRGKNNALIGLTFKVLPADDYTFYGQYVFDADAQLGYQFGVKAADLMGVTNLFAQLEYNTVNKGTYSHNNSQQGYTHFNQELAHPLGAAFNEAVAVAAYRWKDLSVRVKITNATYKTDTAGTRFGSVVIDPNWDGTYPRVETKDETVRNIDLRLAYLVNPSTNMNVIFGVINRTDSGELYGGETLYVYAGFTTNLTNTYTDF